MTRITFWSGRRLNVYGANREWGPSATSALNFSPGDPADKK
ncbi:MAG: hypothetical protein WBB69_12995 [Anaerolineales bacterium]